jgi:hypothetical protein
MTAWALALALAFAGASPSEDYLRCMAYQQPTWMPDDPVAEDCMATILYEGGWARLFRSVGGGLDAWLAEYRHHQRVADARFPRAPESWPDTDTLRPEPTLAEIPGWGEGHRDPFRADALRPMVAEVLDQLSRHGTDIHPGTPIRWSKRYRKKHPVPMTSRLLVTLAFGRTSYFLRTGHEEALWDWILAQPDDSISVPALLTTSLRVCDGDVRQALLTIENLLSRHFLHDDRDRLRHVAKLRPITNTWGHRGDRFGSWYHLFGMVLYTFEHGGAKGRYVAWWESFGSRYSQPQLEERQETFVNRAGARIGKHLLELVGEGVPAGQGVAGHRADARWLEEASYLDLGEYHRWPQPPIDPRMAR